MIICAGQLSDWIDWSPTVFVPLYMPPWVELDGPNANDNEWWWYCECSAYDGEPTEDQAVAAGAWHGWWCDKGRYRYEAMLRPK